MMEATGDTDVRIADRQKGPVGSTRPLSGVVLAEPTGIVPNQWYGILESRSVRRKPVAITRMGERLLLYRTSAGELVCMLNRCPHRGMELTEGRIFGDAIECPFHAFRFDPSGSCVMMPCEGTGAQAPRGMRTITFPVREKHGLIWLWWGASAQDLGLAELPDIPWHDGLPDTPYTSTGSFLWPIPHHRAIENAVDAHHAPALHGQRRGSKGWKVAGLGRRTRNEPFRVQRVPGGFDARYSFHDETRPADKPFEVQVDYREPGMVYAVINSGLYLITIDTPIDANSTWRIIRYYNCVAQVPVLGHLIAWAMRRFDQAAIQWSEDYWIISHQQDEVPGVMANHYVRSDGAVSLYQATQRNYLRAQAGTRHLLPPVVARHFTSQADDRLP